MADGADGGDDSEEDVQKSTSTRDDPSPGGESATDEDVRALDQSAADAEDVATGDTGHANEAGKKEDDEDSDVPADDSDDQNSADEPSDTDADAVDDELESGDASTRGGRFGFGDLDEEKAPSGLRQDPVTEPPDDVEMPITEHIEEMLRRLAYVAVIGGLATIIAFPFASDIVTTMWYDVHPGTTDICVPEPRAEGCAPPHVYGPLELLLTEIKLAGLAGITVALPMLVYQTYQFMRPGLYPRERRYYLSAIPTSLVLAVVGMAFAYFIILPILFTYFLFYSEGSADIAFALMETFDILIMLMAVLAIVFQIPLFVMLAIMMGLTTRQWLEERRIYFWIAFAGIAFVFSPDPTGMAPVMVGTTMVVLFEGTLLLLRWTGR